MNFSIETPVAKLQQRWAPLAMDKAIDCCGSAICSAADSVERSRERDFQKYRRCVTQNEHPPNKNAAVKRHSVQLAAV